MIVTYRIVYINNILEKKQTIKSLNQIRKAF